MGRFWKRQTRRDDTWDARAPKSPRAPRVLEGTTTSSGPVMELVMKAGASEYAEENIKIIVPGTMTFQDFTTRAREALNLAAEVTTQFYIASRLVQPDDEALMSSFKKEGYLYVTYVVIV